MVLDIRLRYVCWTTYQSSERKKSDDVRVFIEFEQDI